MPGRGVLTSGATVDAVRVFLTGTDLLDHYFAGVLKNMAERSTLLTVRSITWGIAASARAVLCVPIDRAV